MPRVSKKDRAFLELFYDPVWIAREGDGELYVFFIKPYKYGNEWFGQWHEARKLNKEYFSFITWESEKAWKITELLELEVEE